MLLLRKNMVTGFKNLSGLCMGAGAMERDNCLDPIVMPPLSHHDTCRSIIIMTASQSLKDYTPIFERLQPTL
jgi:hypothetical protein